MATLTNKDHTALAKLIAELLDAYKDGEVVRDAAVAGLAHMFAAVDKANRNEIKAWFHQRKLEHFRDMED